MFRAADVYEAFLAGQEWQRKELDRMNIHTFKPYEWGQLPLLEKRKFEVIADRLNMQLEDVKEEARDEKIRTM